MIIADQPLNKEKRLKVLNTYDVLELYLRRNMTALQQSQLVFAALLLL